MSDFREEEDEALNALVLPLDEAAGPARRISRDRSAQMVLAALEAGALVAQPSPRPRGKRPPAWLMTGALLVAGAAAAAVWSFARLGAAPTSQVEEASLPVAPRPRTEPQRGDSDSADAAASTTDADGQRDARVAEDAAPSRLEVAPRRGDSEALDTAPSRSAAAPRRGDHGAGGTAPSPRDALPLRNEDVGPESSHGASTASRVADRPAGAEALPAAFNARAPGSARPRALEASAKSGAQEDLLLKANGLRSEGRWKDAEALYLRVIRAEPSSLASYVARVASGSLRLEHLEDAPGALRQFKAALRLQPRGVLDQEAQHGIAEAHRVLGDRNAERGALEAFLAAHPDSPLVPSARARVRELTAP